MTGSRRFCNRPAGPPPSPRGVGQQCGMVLVTVLIMLVVITLLGVTTMTNTGMEEKMAANVQEYNRAFQAAESGISSAFKESDILKSTATEAAPVVHVYNFRNNSETATVNLWYLAQGRDAPPGFSMSGAFRAHYFNMTSTTAAGASLHQQGYYVIGPGS